jgi:hypothetical protein
LLHQSSIAALQSAGVLSNSESRIAEFLTSTEDDDSGSHASHGAGAGHDPFKIISRAQSSSADPPQAKTELAIDPLVTSMLVVAASRTPSSTSIISGVTAVTDAPVEENQLASKETKKSSLISNFGIFGSGAGSSSNSQHVEVTKNDQDDLCGDLGSLYGGGGGSVDDRPIRKPFFSNKSPQNSNVSHRLTFSHENPISSDASAAANVGVASSGGSNAASAPPSKKLSHAKSSFSKSSSYDSSSATATTSGVASVGAENASRFMKRRSVTTFLEGRPSGLTSPPIDSTTVPSSQQQPMSPGSMATEESDEVSVLSAVSTLEARPSALRDKLRRRGSASAALAQQTAQFRKKVSDQAAGSVVEE